MRDEYRTFFNKQLTFHYYYFHNYNDNAYHNHDYICTHAP